MHSTLFRYEYLQFLNIIIVTQKTKVILFLYNILYKVISRYSYFYFIQNYKNILSYLYIFYAYKLVEKLHIKLVITIVYYICVLL